jgi:hypothetical protein
MRMLRSTLPLFFIMGLISGAACWALHFVLPDQRWIIDYYPGVVLGFFLYIAGDLAGIKCARGIPALLTLLAAGILGWRLAIEVGYDSGGPAPFVNAGALGGLVPALGALLAWRVRVRSLRFAAIATAAGALGGLVFHFLDAWFIGHMQDDDLWVLILFAEWQSIFMAGVALALHFSRVGRT